MRIRFGEELDQLNRDMISMGALCENAINLSIRYLKGGDASKREEVQKLMDQISHKEREIENMCLKLLMQQQPVAKDLRTVSAALKMVSDLERIGNNAEDIAEIVSLENISPEAVEKLKLLPMAKEASIMVSSAIDSFVKRDEVLAQEVIDKDDIVDNYFNELKIELAGDFVKSKVHMEAILDLLMIIKYLERIADHAVNIGQWVLFMITGALEGNTT